MLSRCCALPHQRVTTDFWKPVSLLEDILWHGAVHTQTLKRVPCASVCVYEWGGVEKEEKEKDLL